MRALILLLLVAATNGCTPRDEETTTVLPTKQAIGTVSKKLDAAQQETDKRRAEIDSVGK